jgi:hypothetical protein
MSDSSLTDRDPVGLREWTVPRLERLDFLDTNKEPDLVEFTNPFSDVFVGPPS